MNGRMRLGLFALVGALLAGCLSNGRVDEGLPKMYKPLPATTKVYFVRPAETTKGVLHPRSGAAVAAAFEQAFADRGVTVVAKEPVAKGKNKAVPAGQTVFSAACSNGCDVVLALSVSSWGYADAGFSGLGARDEVVLQAMLFNAKTERVLSRATVVAENGVGRSSTGGASPVENLLPAAQKYVDKFFEEKREDAEGKKP